ncbi:MAG: hypothetical protein GX568_10050 [Candidatus Gastranaerophilales bacterium]|nr:hypothetical protein [Candidatus Gastranaerophilales bacterium]
MSTAMHGLIVANSFDIPSIWITASDKIEGGTYKYKDYYSIYDIEPAPPVNINNKLNEQCFENLTENYKVDYNKIRKIQNKLLTVYSKEFSGS